MIAFYWYVLCIGILLSWHANDVMFLGCQANFEMQKKNYAIGTFGSDQLLMCGELDVQAD